MALFTRTTRPPRFGPATKPAELREHYAAQFARFGTIPPGTRFEPTQLGLIKAEWVHVDNAARERMILYFHGGGFIAGSPETHRPLIARLCHAANASALSLNYRLAPEYPFPSPVRDGIDIYRHLIKRGVAPESIVLVGDEAGGGLAFASLLAIRNGNLPMPAGVAAMSPWADLALSGMSLMTNAEDDHALSWEMLFLCARHYLKKMNPSDPYSSPAFAPFKDFPPIMVHGGSREILRDDASKLGDRAAEAGVNVSIEIYDGMGHLFQADETLQEAKISIDRLGQFVRVRTRHPAGATAHAAAGR
jgi:acetyl esterase/lipase